MAGSNKIPAIRPARIPSIPSGYLLGRVSPGVGPPELIPIQMGAAHSIGQNLKNQGLISTVVNIVELSFTIIGSAGNGLTPNTYYYMAMPPFGAKFPSTAGSTAVAAAICRIAPISTVTLYLVANKSSYENNGYPTGVLATIVFTSGQTTGTITWTTNPTTITAATELYLYTSPSTTDSTIEGISVVLVGDYASG